LFFSRFTSVSAGPAAAPLHGVARFKPVKYRFSHFYPSTALAFQGRFGFY
jgi:hypothetical protein